MSNFDCILIVTRLIANFLTLRNNRKRLIEKRTKRKTTVWEITSKRWAHHLW